MTRLIRPLVYVLAVSVCLVAATIIFGCSLDASNLSTEPVNLHISGRITSAEDGEPVQAHVTLTLDNGSIAEDSTDTAGNYEIRYLGDRNCRLSFWYGLELQVRASNYVWYGQRESPECRQGRQEIDVVLTPCSKLEDPSQLSACRSFAR